MISVVILTKNEEKNIADCLQSLSWCDETIVIDDNSTDKTVEIAKKAGAKVYSHPLQNDFSQQRNYGLEKTRNEWVLFVDADERVSSALWYEMMQYTNDPINNYVGFYIKRTDYMWGKELKYGEIGNIKLLRLAKRDAGKWEGKVHEVWKVHGKTLVLNKILRHYPHQSISEFLHEINFYTTLRAAELHRKGVKSYWWTILLYTKGKFILNYIIRGGMFDGLPGLIVALIMSFHSFLVRSKLWLLNQNSSSKRPL